MAQPMNHKAAGRLSGSSPLAAARSSSTTRKARRFAAIEVDGHQRDLATQLKTDSRDGCDMPFFTEDGKVPGTDAIAASLGVLEGMAVYEGSEHALEDARRPS